MPTKKPTRPKELTDTLGKITGTWASIKQWGVLGHLKRNWKEYGLFALGTAAGHFGGPLAAKAVKIAVPYLYQLVVG